MKNHQRRAVMALLVACASTASFAAGYPEKPIRILLGFAPGGTMDLLCRMFGNDIAVAVSQPVVIENRTGANGTIAALAVKNGAADGYILHATTTATQSLLPLVSKGLPYDADRDFTPVATIARVPLVLAVAASHPANTLTEFVSHLRTMPEPSFGSTGSGLSFHMAGLMLQESTGVQMIHAPFRGEVPALTEVAAGRVNAIFATTSGVMPLVTAKKIKVLAVADSTRSPMFPDVPTMAEAGLTGFEISVNYLFMMKTGTANEHVRRLEQEILGAAAKSEIRQKLIAMGMTPLSLNAQQTSELLRRESMRFRPLVSKYRITIE